jgi:hypothetical protein
MKMNFLRSRTLVVKESNWVDGARRESRASIEEEDKKVEV